MIGSFAIHCIAWLAFTSTIIVPYVALPVDIEDLTNFEWEEGQELPEDIAALDRTRIDIEGYVHTTEGPDGKVFLLIPDQKCRCQGAPPPNYFVKVYLDGEGEGHPSGRVRLTGKFFVSEKYEDGFVTSIYRLRGRFIE